MYKPVTLFYRPMEVEGDVTYLVAPNLLKVPQTFARHMEGENVVFLQGARNLRGVLAIVLPTEEGSGARFLTAPKPLLDQLMPASDMVVVGDVYITTVLPVQEAAQSTVERTSRS